MEIVEFLRARLDEDEEYYSTLLEAIQQHLPRQARALREVEAKRRIVDLAGPIVAAVPEDDWGETMHETAMADALRPVLRLLALPYSDHPHYRQEWKV